MRRIISFVLPNGRRPQAAPTLFALLVMLIVTPSFAQKKFVAVVETQVNKASGADKMINKAEVEEITSEIRRIAVNTLPRDRYSVMTTETVQAMGDAVLIECAEENCVIALGTKIGADYIVRGIISMFGQNLSLSVEIFETEYGMLVASADAVRSANVEELLEKASAACREMYKSFLEASAHTAQTISAPELATPRRKTADKKRSGQADSSYAEENSMDEFKKGTSFGIRAAFNVSMEMATKVTYPHLNGFGYGNEEYIIMGLGYDFGLITSTRISKSFAFNSGVNIISRGTLGSTGGLMSDAYYNYNEVPPDEISITEWIIGIPALIQWEFKPPFRGSGNRSYFQLGLQGDITLSSAYSPKYVELDDKSSFALGIVFAGGSYLTRNLVLDAIASWPVSGRSGFSQYLSMGLTYFVYRPK